MKKFKTDLMHFGYLNKNNRYYRESDIDLNDLNGRTIYGEVDHPDRFEVLLQNVSHIVDNFRIEKGVLYGDVEVLNTPKGNVLEELVNSNSIVFRPRGTGHQNKDGTIDGYNVFTFDAIDASKDSFEKYKLRRIKIEKIKNKLWNNL